MMMPNTKLTVSTTNARGHINETLAYFFQTADRLQFQTGHP